MDWWRIVLIAGITALGVGLTYITVVFNIGSWKGSTDTKLDHLTGEAEKDRATMKEFMAEIRADVKKIFQKLPSMPIAGQNPAQLTDFGKQISRTIKAEEWAAAVAPELKEKVAGLPKYQIEAFCRK